MVRALSVVQTAYMGWTWTTTLVTMLVVRKVRKSPIVAYCTACDSTLFVQTDRQTLRVLLIQVLYHYIAKMKALLRAASLQAKGRQCSKNSKSERFLDEHFDT